MTLAAAWFFAAFAALHGNEAASGLPPLQTPSAVAPDAAGLVVLQLRPNFFMIAGAGGNIGVQIGEAGVVVVDAGSAEKAAAVVAAIKNLSPRPIRYIIDTGPDPDHVGGNEALSKAGQTLFTNPGSIALGGDFIGGAASILSAEHVLRRMSAPTGQVSPFPAAAWPTETFDHARKYMYLNGEGIEVLHQPAAHTDGDVMVFFRGSDVIATGDLFVTDSYPVFDDKRGSTMQGYLDALNRMLDITVPRFNQQGGTMVIPGHGRLSNESDVDDYRNWMTIVRDRVQEMVKSGRTLAQVKAARPTLDFDGVYANPKWTTDQFVEAVYKDLSKAPTRASSN